MIQQKEVENVEYVSQKSSKKALTTVRAVLTRKEFARCAGRRFYRPKVIDNQRLRFKCNSTLFIF